VPRQRQGPWPLTSSVQGVDRNPDTAHKGGKFVLQPKPHGNPYDGHTLVPFIAVSSKGLQGLPSEASPTKGYRGHTYTTLKGLGSAADPPGHKAIRSRCASRRSRPRDRPSQGRSSFSCGCVAVSQRPRWRRINAARPAASTSACCCAGSRSFCVRVIDPLSPYRADRTLHSRRSKTHLHGRQIRERPSK